MSGFERVIDAADQIALDRVEFNRSAQPRGEGGDDYLGIVTGPVEPAIYDPLDPLHTGRIAAIRAPRSPNT